jgi:hypothetical protein
VTKVNDFSDALRHVMASDGEALFKSVTVPNPQRRGNDIYWSFSAELAKGSG